MLKSLRTLITLQFALVQLLVPLIEQEYGSETGYLLIRDLGDQLRHILESTDQCAQSYPQEICTWCRASTMMSSPTERSGPLPERRLV